jgi:hypothetical protein
VRIFAFGRLFPLRIENYAQMLPKFSSLFFPTVKVMCAFILTKHWLDFILGHFLQTHPVTVIGSANCRHSSLTKEWHK